MALKKKMFDKSKCINNLRQRVVKVKRGYQYQWELTFKTSEKLQWGGSGRGLWIFFREGAI